ncbi:hypothetical protein AWV79_10805 [Cupriavidus sp. UYMMa02A]|nr:hypothetical protein AWV79_10805 [Cupriavidus sp. UYMMa02A]
MNTLANDGVAASAMAIDMAAATRRKAWGVTAMLTLFMVLNFGDKAVLGLVAKPAMAELGLTPVEFGFIGSSFFFLFSLSAIVVGFLANRVSSRWLILALTMVWAAVQFPILAGGSAAVLLVCRIILGAGEGPALPVALHATHSWFPAEDRALPSNLIAIGPTIGAAIAAPVLSWVIASPALGWRWAFGLLGMAGIAWGIAWACIGKDGPYRSGHGASEGGHVASSATEKLKSVPLRRVFGGRMWLAATLAGFSCFWAQGAMTTWVPQYIGGVLGVEASRVGLVYALPWLFGTILLVVLGFAGRHLMRNGGSARLAVSGLFGASLVVSGTCLLWLPHTTGLLAMVLTTVGWGAFLVFPMAPTAIAYAVNPGQRAAVISTMVGIASIGGVLSPAVFGWLVQKAGYVASSGGMGDTALLAQGLNRAFSLTGLLLLVTGLAAVTLINPERSLRCCNSTPPNSRSARPLPL